MLEPLGFSQVFRYLEQLAESHQIFLISYEKAEDLASRERLAAMRDRCASARIHWYPLRYHKRPTSLATAYDIFSGVVFSVGISVRHRIQVVHARSYVSSVIALVLKRLCRLKFIFDMRGFWADERVEGGLWAKGSHLYRISKWFEKRFLLRADAVVSLTAAAVDEMKTWPYIEENPRRFFVIPTCTDVEKFLPASEKSGAVFTLGYVGSVGLWYEFDPALEFFKILRERIPGARLWILNRDAHSYIRERIEAHQIAAESVMLIAAQQEQIPAYMAEMDAGVFFIKPSFSKRASAPTKFAEFLSCGIPSVVRAGIGDMDEILTEYKVGVSLRSVDLDEIERGVTELLELMTDSEVGARCRRAAVERFSLKSGVDSYSQIYDLLAQRKFGRETAS
jgi:glycosyltransferase involved in cell wall biosynthesis